MQVRVFENRILRRIFEHKRDENEEWRRLHNDDCSYNLSSTLLSFLLPS
jgi:hypothetical protein